MRLLVTGAAGFIGYHTCSQLLARGDAVLGVDNLTPYYDPQLKRARLARLTDHRSFRFAPLDLADAAATRALVDAGPFDAIVHLAAQAGVRYSQEAPRTYVSSNVAGTLNVLEACRQSPQPHLVLASSSSVYGDVKTFPVCESADVTQPVSLYAATKMAGELMAYSYVDQYDLAVTALRFFTVYGPWGRPDMAVFKFTAAILAGQPVDLYAGGVLRRDFTFVGDTVQGILGAIDHPPVSDGGSFRAYNLGRGAPVTVLDLLGELETALNKRALRRNLPPQLGDVNVTFADVRAAERDLGYRPQTSLSNGIAQFVAWYREYYRAADTPVRQSA
jgi:UDP-glucuronate 4-epimerase